MPRSVVGACTRRARRRLFFSANAPRSHSIAPPSISSVSPSPNFICIMARVTSFRALSVPPETSACTTSAPYSTPIAVRDRRTRCPNRSFTFSAATSSTRPGDSRSHSRSPSLPSRPFSISISYPAFPASTRMLCNARPLPYSESIGLRPASPLFRGKRLGVARCLSTSTSRWSQSSRSGIRTCNMRAFPPPSSSIARSA